MITDQRISHRRLDTGYKYFNYAVLHSRGLNHVFDMMRYDTAFFARQSDVDLIIAAFNDYGKALTSRFTLMLGKYDWHGITKPHWTHARLLSDQEYQPLSDVSAVYELNADITALRPAKPLKFRTEIEVTGSVPYILQAMFDNHGFPADEGSAHMIEQAFYVSEPTPITVNLMNYQMAESFWVLPPETIQTPA